MCFDQIWLTVAWQYELTTPQLSPHELQQHWRPYIHLPENDFAEPKSRKTFLASLVFFIMEVLLLWPLGHVGSKLAVSSSLNIFVAWETEVCDISCFQLRPAHINPQQNTDSKCSCKTSSFSKTGENSLQCLQYWCHMCMVSLSTYCKSLDPCQPIGQRVLKWPWYDTLTMLKYRSGVSPTPNTAVWALISVFRI